MSRTGDGALVYDADCAFCTLAARWLAATGRVRTVPWQSIGDLAASGLTAEGVQRSAWWLVDGVAVAAGSAAIARALERRGAATRWGGRLLRARPVRWVAEPAYRLVARNRHRLPGATAACRLDLPR